MNEERTSENSDGVSKLRSTGGRIRPLLWGLLLLLVSVGCSDIREDTRLALIEFLKGKQPPIREEDCTDISNGDKWELDRIILGESSYVDEQEGEAKKKKSRREAYRGVESKVRGDIVDGGVR